MTVGTERTSGTQRLLLVDRPYASDHLREVIDRHGLPVVRTEAAREMGMGGLPSSVPEAAAIATARDAGRLLVYTSSENALRWVAEHLDFTGLPDLVAAFKDKVRFREALRSRYPDFFFREVRPEALDEVRVEELPVPFIIKPSVGFFSLGVHKVSDRSEWSAVKAELRAGLRAAAEQYPPEVLDTTTFIIEDCIPGDEYAVDAYYDAAGRPVVLGIWEHAFASDADTSDRVYTTSRDIVEARLDELTACLAEMGRLTGARDIPVHVEVRRDGDGVVRPIEVNPLRFGGWCTTADLASHAYGFSPYVHFMEQREPDWPAILAEKDGRRHSIVVLDNSTGLDGRAIAAFDYDALLARFSRPIELRRVDWTRYSVFGFLFVETGPDQEDELEAILHSDLTEFVRPVAAG